MTLMITRFLPVLNGLRPYLIAAVLAVSFASPSSAQDAAARAQAAPANPSAGLPQRYPARSIQSVEVADQALADVAKERSRIETQFANDQRACHAKFFMTSCLDTVKEQRRQALAQIRSIEIEANAFKRQARAAEHDRILTDKRAEQEAAALKRKNDQKDKEGVANGNVTEGNAPPTPQPSVKKEADGKQRAMKPAKPDRSGHDGEAADSAVQRRARHQRTQAEEAADAQKRAENVAAYEKKVQDAEARQRDVAAKKAEKERQRAEKKASSAGSPSQ
jgi:colicin import membrane protein